jgi:hypothetical protein
VNKGSKTPDVVAPAADSTNVTTDLEERTDLSSGGAPTGIDVDAAEDATFAAAIGLTPPVYESPRRRLAGLRRQKFPDPTGRPLVTAATATTAAASAAPVVEVPIRGKSPEPVRSSQPPTASQPIVTVPPAQPLPHIGVTPVAVLPEKVSWVQKRRMRARRVRRTVRHIDPWSVFKISILLYACLYIATMAAGVLLWNAAVGSGIIDRFESFMQDLGFETWELIGEEIFRGASIIGLVLVAAGSALNVVMTILFNLISDLTGGVRLTIIEEDLGRQARQ